MKYLNKKQAGDYLISFLMDRFPSDDGIDLKSACVAIFGLENDHNLKLLNSIIDRPDCHIHIKSIWKYIGLEPVQVFKYV